ncbi:MAG: glycoside hydrolase family 2 TIM barrel-domain containing protein [Mariprofundaceae bacterium]|nr:glycoside hydrolase family 2 TIM barrel-domain containing protein [Mariprofundaceae bacterium]
MKILHIIVLLCCFTACVPQINEEHKASHIALDGQWFYAVGEHESRRIPADVAVMQVPSNWWSEGLDASGVVWFYRYVNVAADVKAYLLHFGGVDYQADVFWDGTYLGQHKGYFAPFEMMVGDALLVGEKHLIAVRVDSPKEDSVHWHQQKRLIKGVLSHHDTRPGGAWSISGQQRNTGGIWGSVWLEAMVGVRVQRVRMETETLSVSSATLNLDLKLSEFTEPIQLDVEITSPNGSIVYRRTWSDYDASSLHEHFHIDNPMMWSSWDVGSANLYRLRVRLKEGNRESQYEKRFGVRTIARDEKGRWILNGEAVFLRGTNHIPSLYLASLSRAKLRHDFQLMKEANINAVRVHAHITAPEFYELADEMGIMIWQDFPLQWGYQDHPAVHASVLTQVTEMVDLLGQHPSIIFWNGHNEAPWSAPWMKKMYGQYDPYQNKQLDEDIALKLRELDTSRPSQGNSVSSEHLWFGWYSDTFYKFSEPQTVTTVSELGAQAVPDKTTLSMFLKPNELWPMTKKNAALWKYHNFQQYELTHNAKVVMGSSVDDLIQNSQAYQAHLLQYAIEQLRLQAWKPVTGVFQFMFSEHWPSMSWGVMDYMRQPKKGYAALKQAYQPLLPIANCIPKQGQLECHFSVVNDSNHYYAGATLEVSNGDHAFSFPVQVSEKGVSHFPVFYTANGKGMTLILRNNKGIVIAKNAYTHVYFRALVEK